MYYNSNKNNDDYYNSYKRELAELKAYQKEEKKQKIIKIILSFLSIILLFLAIFYLYKYFNPNNNSKNETLPKITIKKDELPKSIQLRESSMKMVQDLNNNATDTQTQKKPKIVSTMNEKDVTLIVQIIMSKMNTKIKKPLEQELQAVNTKVYSHKPLKKNNHYNKVILTENEAQEVKKGSLMELRKKMNKLMDEKIDANSNYTKAIKKEVVFRKNEMRVIIVQKGDTLSKIAKKAYGNYNAYPKIFAANPEIIKNPNEIFVGQRLRIPS